MATVSHLWVGKCGVWLYVYDPALQPRVELRLHDEVFIYLVGESKARAFSATALKRSRMSVTTPEATSARDEYSSWSKQHRAEYVAAMEHINNNIIKRQSIQQDDIIVKNRQYLEHICREYESDQSSRLGETSCLAETARNSRKSEETEEKLCATNASIKLCLFDLDDTLLRTADLKRFRGRGNIGNQDLSYTAELLKAFGLARGRYIYSPVFIAELRRKYPKIKLGVFTRAPRAYAKLLLNVSYLEGCWDVLIAFEDVVKTKPYGDGILAAMRTCEVESTNQVVLVGDTKDDILAAYQGGCRVVLDCSSWGSKPTTENYRALERIPDGVISQPAQLLEILSNAKALLPELEYQIERGAETARRIPRLDVINHFYPDGGWCAITVMGRLFGEHSALRPRRSWHELTDQVLAHKDAQAFPLAWVQAVRNYLYRMGLRGDCVVTTIPFKPGRVPRMEALLTQVANSNLTAPILNGVRFDFEGGVLAYGVGVLSSHGEHLSKDERFSNAGKFMKVIAPELVRGKRVILIDDVVTTGASLLCGHRYLMDAGAREVELMSLTKTVGKQ